MLRACVIDFGGQWDQFLPSEKFAYNNSYHSSIEMTPLRPCMVGDVDLQLVGLIHLRLDHWVQIY